MLVHEKKFWVLCIRRNNNINSFVVYFTMLLIQYLQYAEGGANSIWVFFGFFYID